MWPFRRKAEAPAAKGPQPVPAPVIRRDWAALPPIQRLVGEHPLTAPSDRFSDDLATHQDPSVMDERMGHQVSAEAPSGMVLTVARPSTTRRDGPAMIPRPHVQRRAEPAVGESGEWNGDEAAPAEAARPTPLPAAPVQRAAAVERPVVQPIAQSAPLTTAPAEVAPAPPASRSYRETAAPHIEMPFMQRTVVHEVSPAPRLTLGQARRLGLGAPINKVPDRSSVQRAAEELSSMPLAPAPTPRAEPATPLQTAAELAAPSSAGDATTPTVSRIATEPDQPIASPMTVARSAAPPGTAADSPRLDLPLAPVGRDTARSDAEEVPMQMSASSEPAAPAAPVMQASSPAPTVTTSELSPGASPAIQRTGMVPSLEADEPSAGLADLTAQRTMSESRLPLAIQRVSPRNPIVTTDLSSAPATLAEVTPHSSAPTLAPLLGSRPIRSALAIQRSSAPHAGADGGVTSAAPPLAAQRSVGGSPSITAPAPDSGLDDVAGDFDNGTNGDNGPGGAAPSSESLALSRPSATTATIQRSSSMLSPARPLRTPLMPSASRERAAQPSSGFADASSASSLPLAPSIPAAIQRAIESNAAAAAEPVATRTVFSVQREEMAPGGGDSTAATPSAAAAATTAATTGHSEQEMNELAGKLYDRIRSRLKTELLVDRERAGLLTDLR